MSGRGRKERKKRVKAREADGGRKVFVVFLSKGLSGVWRGKGFVRTGRVRGAGLYGTPPSSSPPSPPPPSPALLHPVKIRGFVFSLLHGLDVVRKKKKTL